MKKIIFLSLFLCYVSLNAGYEEGKTIFDAKCAKCHTGHVDVDTLKVNFFEKKNKLLNLEAPTVNMLEYAIMRSPKKIGDPNDPEMRQIEIEEFLKEVIAEPEIGNSICDPMIVKNFKPKKKGDSVITDEEAVELSYFFMEYKGKREASKPKKKKIISGKVDEAEVLKEVKEQDKLILVEASSKTCFFCKKMKKEVISQKDVQDILNKHYVHLEIMIEDTKLPFGVEKVFKQVTPTYFILSKDGKILKSYPGSWKKVDFIKNLKENL